MSRPALDIIPLGGTGEIGMNLNLYGTAGRWLMVDAGVMFERTAGGGMRVLYPDPSFIVSQRHRLEALVITHAHQDHLGAVADIWPLLRCPVYATPFAAAMLEGPLAEAGLRDQVPIKVIPEVGRFTLGPFRLRRVPLTHSTVEMGALLIETDAGTVFHTGDFKLDDEPIAGLPLDRDALRRLGRVDLCVSDSTNADHEGWTPSESTVVEPLRRIVAGSPARVFVSLFSSHVARVQTLARLADEEGRDLVFVGRALERAVGAARRCGYLQRIPPIVPAREFGYIPARRVLVVCTGSQGEPGAGLSRIAAADHPEVYADPDDTVVFSARAIPGNELPLERVVRLLQRQGARVITDADADVHVSGHPRRDELRALYGWVQPRHVMPVHGTPTKLEAHAELAESMDLGAVRARNGQRVRLCDGQIELLDRVRTGRLERPAQGERPKPWDRQHEGRVRRR